MLLGLTQSPMMLCSEERWPERSGRLTMAPRCVTRAGSCADVGCSPICSDGFVVETGAKRILVWLVELVTHDG